MSSKNDTGHSRYLEVDEGIAGQFEGLEKTAIYHGKRLSLSSRDKRYFEDRFISSLYIEELLEKTPLSSLELEAIRDLMQGKTISEEEKDETKTASLSAIRTLNRAITKIREHIYFTEIVVPMLCKYYQRFSDYFDLLPFEQRNMIRQFQPQNPNIEMLGKRSLKGQKRAIPLLTACFEFLLKICPECLEEYNVILEERGYSYIKKQIRKK